MMLEQTGRDEEDDGGIFWRLSSGNDVSFKDLCRLRFHLGFVSMLRLCVDYSFAGSDCNVLIMASYLYKGLEVQLMGSGTLILKPHISQQCPKGW
ncbi:hypothetical protein Hanom_Chr08g00731111 [Helianthus anomalus]